MKYHILLKIIIANLFFGVVIPLIFTYFLFYFFSFWEFDDNLFWIADNIVTGFFYVVIGGGNYIFICRENISYWVIPILFLFLFLFTVILYILTDSFVARFNEPLWYIYFPFVALVPLYVFGVFLFRKLK